MPNVNNCTLLKWKTFLSDTNSQQHPFSFSFLFGEFHVRERISRFEWRFNISRSTGCQSFDLFLFLRKKKNENA